MSFLDALYPDKPKISEPVKVVVMAPRKVAEEKAKAKPTLKVNTKVEEVKPKEVVVVETKKREEDEPKQKQRRFIKGSEEAKKWAEEMASKRKASREAKQSAKVVELKE